MGRFDVARGLVVLVALATTGCVPDDLGPSEQIVAVYWLNVDFESSRVGSGRELSDVVAVAWAGSVSHPLEQEMQAYVAAHAHVVSVSARAEVGGEAREGFHRLGGEVVADPPPIYGGDVVSFVPSEPLSDGWYVAAVDFNGWIAAHPESFPAGVVPSAQHVEDGWLYRRFQVGAVPTWVGTMAFNDLARDGGERSLIYPRFSEPWERGASPIGLLVDGASDPLCETLLYGDSYFFAWQCPVYPDDTTITLRLEGPEEVATLGGAASHTSRIGDYQLVSSKDIEPRFGVDIARSAL